MLISGKVVRVWQYANGETGEVFQKVSLNGLTEAYPAKRIVVRGLQAYPEAGATINSLEVGQSVVAEVAPFGLGERYPWFGAVDVKVKEQMAGE